MTKAVRNTQDGISFIQTAEGVLNNILQRMREVLVQIANDALTAVDRIASTIEFNTKKSLAVSPQS